MRKWSKWLIFTPVAILSLFAPTANAQSQQGLTSVAYTVSDIPPTKSDNAYPICNEEIENNINRNYNGEPLDGCPVDMFMIHMTGTIIIPQHETIEFWLASDDGGTISIGGNEWGNWGDQGCSWMESGQIYISAGEASLDFWLYENGGSTCAMLAWNIDNAGFAIVPDEAFSTDSQVSVTTTTDSPVTTIPETTTTTTTTTIPVTTLPQTTTTTTTTTEPPTTTSAPTTTSSATTSSSVPQTTSTQSSTTTISAPLPQSSTTTYLVVPSTTTTEFVSPTTSELPVVVILLPTEEPVEELPFPQPSPDVVPTPEVVDTIPDTVPTLEIVTTIIEVVDTVPDAVVDAILPPISTPDAPLDAIGSDLSDPIVELPPVGDPITDEALDSIIENAFTPDALPEETVAALTEILGSDLTEEQFTTVMETVFSEEASVEQMSAVVDNLLDANLSTEEVMAVFESAFDSDLSDAETVALAEELLSKPLDDKEFGAVVNAIFDEKVSDEVLAETFSAILTPEISDSKFAQVVNVLENATITSDQVAQVVDLVIAQDGGISEGQATELATSAKVLESVDGEQAEEVFGAVEASNLSSDEGLAIVTALENAEPTVVKAFEKKLDVFQGSFDTYKPIGSSIPIRERRILNIVTATLFVMSAPIPVVRVSAK